MKTPARPTRLRRSDKLASHLATVLPWGATSGRIAVEQAKPNKISAVRSRLRQAATEYYPTGKALARQASFLRQRGFPGGLAAAGNGSGQQARQARARVAKQAARLEPMSFKAQAKTLPPLWREIGPTLVPQGQTYGSGPGSTPSVSGRCCGVMIDRNDSRHLVLCSAGGGLWGSHDAGATWTPLTDRQPTLLMGAIAQAPSSPAVAYAATGDGDGRIAYGVGLLRSTDGGDSWALAPNAELSGVGSYDLAVDPADPLRVWIATDQGLFLSTNGGDTAKLVLSDMCWSVSLHPVNASEILVAQRAGVKRSIDGGATWKAVTLPGAPGNGFARLEVCHAPSDPGIVYVAGAAGKASSFLWRRPAAAGVFASLNAPSQLQVGQAWYDWCFSVSPGDPDTVFWGAIDLFRGHHGNGTVSWSNVSSRNNGDSIHPDQHFLAFDPNDPQSIYACNDGGLYRSPDLGGKWVSLNPGLGITEFEYLAQLASDPHWLMGGTQDNGTLSMVGDRRWDQVALGDGGDCAAVDRDAASICYHSYYDMPLERARTHGASAFAWTDISPPVPNDYPCLFYPPMDARGSSVAKAGATIWVSGNDGKTWAEIQLPTSADAEPDLATALTFVGDDVMVVGMETGQLWGLGRGVGRWSNAPPLALAALPNAYVSDICAVEGSPTIWATCSAIGGPHVFCSTDGGQTFSNRTGNLPDVAVNAVVADAKLAGTVYIGTDRGVYRTTDGGKHWKDFSNGLPNAIVGSLLMHGATRRLRAGTRSRGAWELDL